MFGRNKHIKESVKLCSFHLKNGYTGLSVPSQHILTCQLRTKINSSNFKALKRDFNPWSQIRKTFFENYNSCQVFVQKDKQDGRLAPAYFSHNYKYFDQLLQTVKNETTVLNLVFKEFLQTSIPPLISILYAKKGVSRFFVENFLPHSTEKFRRRSLVCFRKFPLSKNLKDKRGGGGGVARFSVVFIKLKKCR